MHCWLDGNESEIRHKSETKTKTETKQNCGQNNLSHAKFCVFALLLSCSDSALPKCPGHCLFWKVYILGFSMEWSNFILSGTSELQLQIEEGLSKNCLDWVLDILVCLICRDLPKFLGGKGVVMLKTELKIIPNNTVLTSKGTRLLQMIFTLDVLLWTSNFELEN